MLQRAIERIPSPKDGAPGRDGLSIEDFDATLGADGRTLTLRFSRGEVAKEFAFRLAIPIDCGVYREDASYAKGDGVTFGGSWFIAQKDAPVGKPGDSDDWRLSVKRGRDGKDAAPIPATVAARTVNLK